MQRNKPGMEGIASKIYKGLNWKKNCRLSWLYQSWKAELFFSIFCNAIQWTWNRVKGIENIFVNLLKKHIVIWGDCNKIEMQSCISGEYEKSSNLKW